ncbi:MAG: hypothetical protein DI598_03370 [Pseudopedobacter saltans]|uniref:Tail specific protease domain-containing protein n=1 Tax=Pseudopedobacter saltans TaxID=151895 RepID=A0A2W5FCH4_9SPHI|nr:MAG: hypothetical protein DI598_03370 [Pseudopedobacter saltans]
MNTRKLFCLIILSIIVSNCDAQKALLDSIIRVVKNQSTYTNDVNWNSLIPQLYESIDVNQKDSVQAIIPAVEKMFNALGDKHGQLHYLGKAYFGTSRSSASSNDYSDLRNAAYNEKYAFRTKVFDKNYGYISIPAQTPALTDSSAKDPKRIMATAIEMAQTLNDSLCKLTTVNGIKGIIVDLRLNFGGSSVISIEGLSSAIGKGNILFYAGKSDTSIVSLVNGAFFVDNNLVGKLSLPCKISNIKIAVIVGHITGSAGEHTAIAFKGRENTKFFGERTAGYTTTNEEVVFSKDLFLAFSAGNVLDRNRFSYTNGIDPEIRVIGGDNFADLQKDSKVIMALKWLKEK